MFSADYNPEREALEAYKSTLVKVIKSTFSLGEEVDLRQLNSEPYVRQVSEMAGLKNLLVLLNSERGQQKPIATALETVVVQIKLKGDSASLVQKAFLNHVENLVDKPLYRPK